MNPFPSFFGPSFSSPYALPLVSGMLAPPSSYEISYLSAIQREQQNLQMLKQMQVLKLRTEMQNSYMSQHLQNPSCFSYKYPQYPVETNFVKIQLPSPGALIMAPIKETSTSQTFTPSDDFLLDQQDSNQQLKSQIDKMLQFFVSKFEKIPQEEISQERAKYASNAALLKLFDKLVHRYSAAGKSREDMTRSVLRGALKFLKNSYRTKFNLTSKAASIKLCQKYFKPEDMESSDIDFEDEDQVLSFLLPYKKNSRNKTPNTRFITEIFASEEFCQDYAGYLEDYDSAFEKDNDKKITRFSEFLLKCVQDDAIERAQNYKRLPWLNVWQEAAKIIALELLDKKLLDSFNNKIQNKNNRKHLKS